MKWFEKYGEIPIMGIIWLVYILIYCFVPFTIIKFVLAIIGAFVVGWTIAKVSFWLRDKIIKLKDK